MTDKGPQIVNEDYLESAMVQISFRLPLRLRLQLDKYLQWMNSHAASERPTISEDWPRTQQATIGRALEDFLASHMPTERRGPDKIPPRQIKAAKKRPKIAEITERR